jgi:hypothetical protein
MIDTKLIADALNKSANQQHLAANHCTCYQGNMTRYLADRSDLSAKNEAEFHERVLRSFLVTGCIRTSEKIIQTTCER